MTDVDMAMSGMITFGLLIVLIGCLNGQTLPKHLDAVYPRAQGRSAIITCNVGSSLDSTALHWYRAQPGGAFQRLMYFEAKSTKAIIDPGVPRRYAGSVRDQQVSLTISKLQSDDAGSYYCALWTDNDTKVFGSGTRLYVTDPGKDTIIPPTLTAYLPTKKQSGKQTVLCQATKMFPDLVKFTWKKKGNTGDWTDVSAENFVEQRNENPVIVTSMLIVDQNAAPRDLYQCILTHEGGKEAPQSRILQEENVNKDPAEKSEDVIVQTTCAPYNETLEQQISGSSDQIPSLYLFVYAYGVMLMKNGVYFCAVFIFLLKRKYGK
ncbi:immunoglobulin kappa light chain-like isoform X2 [Siphateles boraxobius]|uniref:immunoglobulin kappa light chain-like isoform X2 n=1 Tax=Siphateles boraxobius TaxID=180520 RepID=UPI004064720B